ncbi:hypothetical protein BOS5A_130147 [Bosea sp. EC-HK365B]|nr:hypothetical protein BOSE21B_111182 [Bosea sp. 21B]VVT56041.1 hypothetical protein BOS5A_130147 [Bosea sp. EC-HK365B]
MVEKVPAGRSRRTRRHGMPQSPALRLHARSRQLATPDRFTPAATRHRLLRSPAVSVPKAAVAFLSPEPDEGSNHEDDWQHHPRHRRLQRHWPCAR